LGKWWVRRWFLSYDRRRGNASGPKASWLWVRKAAAPATVTGEILKQPLTEMVGKAGIRGETLLRKPGDLPALKEVNRRTGCSATGSESERRIRAPHRLPPI